MKGVGELTEVDLAGVAELERRVVGRDGGRLKLGWPSLRSGAPEVAATTWTSEGRVVGFLGSYLFAAVPELAGMVDPDFRRRGIATALLHRTLRSLAGRGEREALIVCPRTGSGGADFARAHGGRADHSEHALALRGGPRPAPERPEIGLRAATVHDSVTVRRFLAEGFELDPGEQSFDGDGHLVIERHGETVGYLRAPLDRERATGDIYGFVIRRDLRGQGIGRDVLCRASRDLFRRGARTVGLEVETANEHALGLYTSLGFERVVTEDYYRFSVAENTVADGPAAHGTAADGTAADG